jgi:hypothetical protein
MRRTARSKDGEFLSTRVTLLGPERLFACRLRTASTVPVLGGAHTPLCAGSRFAGTAATGERLPEATRAGSVAQDPGDEPAAGAYPDQQEGFDRYQRSHRVFVSVVTVASQIAGSVAHRRDSPDGSLEANGWLADETPFQAGWRAGRDNALCLSAAVPGLSAASTGRDGCQARRVLAVRGADVVVPGLQVEAAEKEVPPRVRLRRLALGVARERIRCSWVGWRRVVRG